MKRDAVDFSSIPETQWAIHARLENWARSLFGASGSSASPTFRLYRSSEQWVPPSVAMPFDSHDAIAVAKGVRDLPTDNRAALDWYYVRTGAPMKACRAIGCTMQDLARYTIDARQMLINRKV